MVPHRFGINAFLTWNERCRTANAVSGPFSKQPWDMTSYENNILIHSVCWYKGILLMDPQPHWMKGWKRGGGGWWNIHMVIYLDAFNKYRCGQRKGEWNKIYEREWSLLLRSDNDERAHMKSSFICCSSQQCHQSRGIDQAAEKITSLLEAFQQIARYISRLPLASNSNNYTEIDQFSHELRGRQQICMGLIRAG